MVLSNLSPNSRVWVYKSDRPMTTVEKNVIKEELNNFIPQWAAHGNKLFGGAEVVNDWFVVMAVDESQALASGCSIDSSVKFIREIGERLTINFFDRMHVLISKGGIEQNIHFSALSNYQDWKIYDPMIENLSDYTSHWLVNINESRFGK